MTKDEAREMLDELVSRPNFTFPMHDVACKFIDTTVYPSDCSFSYGLNPTIEFKDITFRELLKIAYDLKDKEHGKA